MRPSPYSRCRFYRCRARPTGPCSASRRASHEGMVSVGGNLYHSVPDTTRRRVFDVHVLADEIRIFEDCALVTSHLPLEGRGEKRLDPRRIENPAASPGVAPPVPSPRRSRARATTRRGARSTSMRP